MESKGDIEEPQWGLEPAGPLSADQEKDLAEFLGKVMTACKSDSSVPEFVGLQVQEWLKEMEEKKDETTGEEIQGD
jgi:hypothetical protein